jgi:gamma-glutamyltranspeptidase / glutathione hydrolase
VLIWYRLYPLGMRGAVAAGHPLSAEAGATVLAAGGNAVDALIGTAFAAFVTEGPLTGPAGGGFLLVHDPDDGPTLLDCFFAVPAAPLGVMDEVVIDFADASTQTFHVGEGSVAVPGLLAGLEEAHSRYASRPWPELVEPAIALAHAGFARDEPRAFLHSILAPILLRTADGARVYGNAERVVTEELVATLERIRDAGAAAAADLLPEYADDLAAYRVAERTPLEAAVLADSVLATPPPSRGGAIVLEILSALAAGGDPSLDARARAIGIAYGRAAGTLTGTTHVSVVDAQGRAAALSSTLGSGSGVFRAGTQLNNMLGELDVIGIVERPRGERLPSMMTPTVALQEGSPRLVLGSAGSVRLAGAIAQVVWNVLYAGMPLADAIDAPRLHVEGATVHVEGGWDEAATATLGPDWEVVRWGARNLYFGGVAAVERRPDGSLAAAGDPRRGGHGVVVG